ncbi:NAD(P)-dependent oxidoreductase [Candidatus Solirubrobacter pratensis]|uniref:NAD(P)-dependent oxidoreductase n=1 Tax=Candidatus Solirubrobacter pratensis TaxID=1298857 RepID=UPI000425101F|nr:NAD(P)-dependent oxidoreductase [Candidatus Solirubrobacter pratensis]
MESIGVIGLEHMGGDMAARWLAAGYTVYGTTRSRARAQWLVEHGLRPLDTPRAIAEAVDVIVTSLPDDCVLESVASGPDGILAGLRAGKVWLDMSTVSPDGSRELAARARERGAEMLDAPVSGTVPQVQAGTPTIMIGGDEEACRRVEPVLRVLGTPRRIGEHGQALVLKLAINISLAVQMLAFSEGLLLADREGIDLQLAAEVMAESAIGSPMLKARVPLVLDTPDAAWFDIAQMHRDIRLALATAHELDVPLPSAGVADDVLAGATTLGYQRRDIAAIYGVLARLAEPPCHGALPVDA